MEFKPKTPLFKEKVQESFNRQGFMKYINARLKTVSAGYCEIEIPYHTELTQQHGFFHAGVVGTLADNVSGYAAFSLMDERSSILTVEFKLNLLAPASGELLIAKGSVLKSGRTLTICRAEVFSVNKGKETLCAASQATLIELKDRPDARE